MSGEKGGLRVEGLEVGGRVRITGGHLCSRGTGTMWDANSGDVDIVWRGPIYQEVKDRWERGVLADERSLMYGGVGVYVCAGRRRGESGVEGEEGKGKEGRDGVWQG
eukprot:54413-Eustigmatos_ZCMA.PRE.1